MQVSPTHDRATERRQLAERQPAHLRAAYAAIVAYANEAERQAEVLAAWGVGGLAEAYRIKAQAADYLLGLSPLSPLAVDVMWTLKAGMATELPTQDDRAS
jgi:hypothetical protein